MTDIIQMVCTIAFTGLIVWGILFLAQPPEPFRRAIYVVSVLGLVYYVLSHFGLARFQIH